MLLSERLFWFYRWSLPEKKGYERLIYVHIMPTLFGNLVVLAVRHPPHPTPLSIHSTRIHCFFGQSLFLLFDEEKVGVSSSQTINQPTNHPKPRITSLQSTIYSFQFLLYLGHSSSYRLIIIIIVDYYCYHYYYYYHEWTIYDLFISILFMVSCEKSQISL